MANNERNANDMGAYLFHQGTNYFAYDYLGCHESIIDGKRPNATVAIL